MSKRARREEKQEALPGMSGPTNGDTGIPPFDVQALGAEYSSHLKVARLTFIAKSSPQYALNAFRMAIEELKKGRNVPLFLETVSAAREALGSALGDEWGLDNSWVTTQNRRVTESLNTLEANLANAKRTGEREPIRAALVALAEFHNSAGNFNEALTKFIETKECNSTNMHSLETCIGIMRTSSFAGSLGHIKNQAQRAQTIPEIKNRPDWQALVQASLGLFFLKSGQFSAAAGHFLQTTADIAPHTDVVTQRDVGVYGSICALASYSRADIKDRVLGNEEFKKFLELMPWWRVIIHDFYTSNYGRCFSALEALRPQLMLDLLLAPPVATLIQSIKTRALVQYFKPFTAVNIQQMAGAFHTNPQELEKQLVGLIAENKIQARVDSHNKIVYARDKDQRNVTFQEALATGSKYTRNVKSLLMRISFAEQDFVLRHPDQELRRRDEEKE